MGHQRSRRGNDCGRLASRTVALEDLEMNFKEYFLVFKRKRLYLYSLNQLHLCHSKKYFSIPMTVTQVILISLFFTSAKVIFFSDFHIDGNLDFTLNKKYLGTMQKEFYTISVTLPWL